MVFTVIFLLEALIKIIAYGFLTNGETSYLRKSWNQLDFFIVIVSIVELALSGSSDSLSIVKVFRTFRILRPLRIVTKNQSLQIAVTALMKSMPKIINLQLLTSFFIFMLAIFQTHIYSGKFNVCQTKHLGLKSAQKTKLIDSKWDCLNYGGEWLTQDFNYDYISRSFVTLSSLSSNEGWN